MPKQWDNTNHGILFNNQDRKKSDKDKDYGGQINVDGQDYWLSGWIRTSKKGNKFLSLSVKPKEEVVARRSAGNGDTEILCDELNDEIPY